MARESNAVEVETELPVRTLEEIEQAAAFVGFAPDDFAVFELPDFDARMPALRAQVTPKLKQIGSALVERLSEITGDTLYPHVAQHLRRSVNPPEETWAAFAHEKRSYKPFVHLRAAISADHARVLVFVEDDADEKATFAENLVRNAGDLSEYLAHHPTIRAFDILDENGAPSFGSALDADTLRAFGERLRRVKGQHARFGIAFDKSHPVLASGPEFLQAIEDAVRVLKPLYDCGKPGFVYTYVPEPIPGL